MMRAAWRHTVGHLRREWNKKLRERIAVVLNVSRSNFGPINACTAENSWLSGRQRLGLNMEFKEQREVIRKDCATMNSMYVWNNRRHVLRTSNMIYPGTGKPISTFICIAYSFTKLKSETTRLSSATKSYNKLASWPPRSKLTLKSPTTMLTSHLWETIKLTKIFGKESNNLHKDDHIIAWGEAERDDCYR